MNKQSSSNDKKQLQRRVEESVKNAAAAKKVRDRPVGRAAPQLKPLIEKKSTPTPYSTRNGDVKPPPTSSSLRPSSAVNSKPTNPWQRPKVQPASAVYGNKNGPSSRPNSAAAPRRVSSGQAQTNNSSVDNSSGVKPSALIAKGSGSGPTQANNSSVDSSSGVKPSALIAKNRPRAVSSVVNSSSPSNTGKRSSSPRNRSTSSPSKETPVNKKPPMANKPPLANDNKSSKTSSNSPVSYRAGKNAAVALPKIEKTDATLQTKKEEKKGGTKKDEEKLSVPPRRSRAHVMPISKTAKPQKKGHDFIGHELTDWVNWCDACGSMILSLFGKCVKCKKCMMVCHAKCALTVSLTCEADEVRAASIIDPAWYKTIVEETTDEATLKEYNTITRVLPKGELKERIDKFNKTVKSTQQMTLQEDGETFRGFIRVTMNLTRPVSVGGDDKEKEKRKLQRQASFYVNKGAVKALYLSSGTTAEEVVSALLNKYGIKDNPLKFALFEKQVREEGHIILRKMMTRERPLFLRLLWGDGNTQQHAFILQENESREIQWESFSTPELLTFLKILEKEQNDHITCIKTKYSGKRQDILNAMDYQKKKGDKK